MTIRGFPTDDPLDPTTELEWRRMFRWLMESGVLADQLNELAVSQRGAGANMSVDVASGHSFHVGHMMISDAVTSVAIPNNGTGNDRIDLIVAGFDFAANEANIYRLAGTPDPAPVPPDPTQDILTLWEVPLAEVLVEAGESTSIVDADITDARTIVHPYEGPPPLPAYTTAERDALTATDGLTIYNTTTDEVQSYVAGSWEVVQLEGGTTIRVAWTYTLPGEIKVPSGSTDFLPPAPISVPAGQTVELIGYIWTLWNGTSFTFSLQHRTGSALATTTTLVSGVTATSASVKGSGTFTAKSCADGDSWQPIISGVSSTPSGGSVAILADVTV